MGLVDDHNDVITVGKALIINPPKTARWMWVFARKGMFCKESDASGLNGVGGFMIKAVGKQRIGLALGPAEFLDQGEDESRVLAQEAERAVAGFMTKTADRPTPTVQL